MTTYGALMDQAMSEFAAALATPTRFRGLREFRDRDLRHALLIVRARARLYRGLAGALRPIRRRLLVDAPAPAADWAAQQLHDEAAACAAAVGAILSQPEPTDLPVSATVNSAMALHLLRAADLAGAGWDLAAAYTTRLHRTPDMTVEAVYALHQQVQTDAADLAGALGDLDSVLASTLRPWADVPGLAPEAREAIQATLADTTRTHHGHLTHYATVFLANTARPLDRPLDRSGARPQPIQSLRPIPVFNSMFNRQAITSPGTAAKAVALMRQWMWDDPGTITAQDLYHVAWACHRLALLSGQTAVQPAHQPGQGHHRPRTSHTRQPLETAAAWRQLATALREFPPLAAPTEHAALPVAITGWATQYLRADTPLPLITGDEPIRTRRRWITAIQETTAYLPDLAHLTGQHLATQLRRGNIVSPRGENDQLRYSRPAPSHLEQLGFILRTVIERSAHLARLTLDLRPDTHPVPHIVDHARGLATAPTALPPALGGRGGGELVPPALRTELAHRRARRRRSRERVEDPARQAPNEPARDARPRHRS
jgi:hypothetical protein